MADVAAEAPVSAPQGEVAQEAEQSQPQVQAQAEGAISPQQTAIEELVQRFMASVPFPEYQPEEAAQPETEEGRVEALRRLPPVVEEGEEEGESAEEELPFAWQVPTKERGARERSRRDRYTDELRRLRQEIQRLKTQEQKKSESQYTSALVSQALAALGIAPTMPGIPQFDTKAFSRDPKGYGLWYLANVVYRYGAAMRALAGQPRLQAQQQQLQPFPTAPAGQQQQQPQARQEAPRFETAAPRGAAMSLSADEVERIIRGLPDDKFREFYGEYRRLSKQGEVNVAELARKYAQFAR